MQNNDLVCMERALVLAKQAMMADEVPVGAVCSIDDCIVSEAINQTITQCNPCAHAEILALTQAAKQLGNYRLTDLTVYVSLEPCLMCVGAMLQARIKRLVYGCADKRFGVFSKENLFNIYKTNHIFSVDGGVLGDKAGQLLTAFFESKRG